MKNIIVIGFIASLLISCGSPAAVPTIEPTREEPKKSAPIDIAVATATATIEIALVTDNPTATATSTATRTVTATYTPRPTIITSTPTEKVQRSISTPGKVTGRDSETLNVIGDLPEHISVSSVNEIRIDVVLSDGRRVPLGSKLTMPTGTKALALDILATGGWSIEFIAGATPTVAKRSVVPTRRPVTFTPIPVVVAPSPVPTVFLPATNPPPKTCCKHCTPGKSKACGDSCIGLDKTCHQPPGCAC